MSAIDDIHTLTIRLRELSRNQNKLDTTSVGQLKQCCRGLLNVLETLSRIHARHPATVNAARWDALSAVEAAKRIIWLLGRPLTAKEILEELTQRGWSSRPTKTPGATLSADLDHAKNHVRHVGFNQWDITPAAAREQLALAIFSAVEESEPQVPELLSEHARRRVRTSGRAFR